MQVPSLTLVIVTAPGTGMVWVWSLVVGGLEGLRLCRKGLATCQTLPSKVVLHREYARIMMTSYE